MPRVPILYLTLLALVLTTMSQDIPGSQADAWLPRNGLVKKATSSSLFFSKDRLLALDVRQEEECPPGYIPCGGFEYCCPESDSNCCGNNYCCPSSDNCVLDLEACCPKSAETCGGKSCCKNGSTCCEDGSCCPGNDTCCPEAGGCCPSGYQCCEGTCCPEGSKCAGKGKCNIGTATSQVVTETKTATNTKTEATSTATPTVACPQPRSAAELEIDRRDFTELEKRSGEEYWFRFEDPNVANAGNNILPGPSHPHLKDYDDQAYKWISMDASKVTREASPKRAATVYVLPKGTRERVLAQAKDFYKTRSAKEASDFVTKSNEPGDVGINRIANAGDGTALDDFRNKVIRTVVKITSPKAKGQAKYVTITKGKKSNTASKADQAALKKFC